MAATFTAAAIGVAFANGKSMISLMNNSGSSVVLRVYRVWLLNNQTTAVTGVLTTFAMRRISAVSGGTTVTPVKHDTTSTNLPAQVVANTGATATNTADTQLRTWMWSNDEPAASSATNDEFENIIPLMCVWDSTGDSNIEPLTLRAGEGVTITHTGTSAVGVCDLFIEFTST